MANYEKAGVNLTKTQLKKINSTVKRKTGTTLKY